MAGVSSEVRIVPFRGEYYRMSDDGASLIRALIYPVPDPRFPFLGVHFTRRIDDTVEVGPNAVLATRREGYRKRDVAATDLLRMVTFPGFWRLARREWRAGGGGFKIDTFVSFLYFNQPKNVNFISKLIFTFPEK